MWECKLCGNKEFKAVMMIDTLGKDGTYECCDNTHDAFECASCGYTSEYIDDIAEWVE